MKKSNTVNLHPVHAYIVAEALAHALNSGHYAELEKPTTDPNTGARRYSMFAWVNLAQQALDQIADAGIITRPSAQPAPARGHDANGKPARGHDSNGKPAPARRVWAGKGSRIERHA